MGMSIEELIKRIGLTDTELGARICCSGLSVARWRKGRKVPSPMARKALCRLAAVKIEDVDWTKA